MQKWQRYLVLVLAGVVIGAVSVWLYASAGADDIRREANELRAHLDAANSLLGNLRDEYYGARATIRELEATNRRLEKRLDILQIIYTELDEQVDIDRQAVDGIREGAQEGLRIIDTLRAGGHPGTPE